MHACTHFEGSRVTSALLSKLQTPIKLNWRFEAGEEEIREVCLEVFYTYERARTLIDKSFVRSHVQREVFEKYIRASVESQWSIKMRSDRRQRMYTLDFRPSLLRFNRVSYFNNWRRQEDRDSPKNPSAIFFHLQQHLHISEQYLIVGCRYICGMFYQILYKFHAEQRWSLFSLMSHTNFFQSRKRSRIYIDIHKPRNFYKAFARVSRMFSNDSTDTIFRYSIRERTGVFGHLSINTGGCISRDSLPQPL